MEERPAGGYSAQGKGGRNRQPDRAEVLANNVDSTKVGVYEVTYKVADNDGAGVTKKSIKVMVQEKKIVPTPDTPMEPVAPSESTEPTLPAVTPQTGGQQPCGAVDCDLRCFHCCSGLTDCLWQRKEKVKICGNQNDAL